MKYMVIGIVTIVAAIMGFGTGDFSGSASESKVYVVNANVGDVYSDFNAVDDNPAELLQAEISSGVSKFVTPGQTVGFDIDSSKDDDGSNITFEFTPREDGGTEIKATVNVPPVRAPKDPKKYISEFKVLKELEKTLQRYADSKNTGGSGEKAINNVSEMLLAIDLGTNPSKWAKAEGFADTIRILDQDTSDQAQPATAENFGEPSLRTKTTEGASNAYASSDNSYGGSDYGSGSSDEWSYGDPSVELATQ